MGLFGKPKISEREAAGQFVLAILTGVRENWTEITTSFRTLMVDTTKLDSPWSQFEFGVAALATQLRAVGNLCPADQARRIRDHVVDCLSSPEVGATAVESLGAYDAAWQGAIEAGEPPFGPLVATMCHRLRIGPSDIATVGEFMDPLFIMALGGAITTAFPGWWKNLMATHRLVA